MILGIGTDVVEISRFKQLLERQPERSVERLFTESEKEYCDSKQEPIIHYAARFAAKEAFLKAMGTGLTNGIRWSDMSIVKNQVGAPEFFLTGRAFELTQERNLLNIHLSISHTNETAIAFVILEGGMA
ncbi:MAG: holo-ACP synthase [Sumerlaeia bacterium]